MRGRNRSEKEGILGEVKGEGKTEWQRGREQREDNQNYVKLTVRTKSQLLKGKYYLIHICNYLLSSQS